MGFQSDDDDDDNADDTGDSGASINSDLFTTNGSDKKIQINKQQTTHTINAMYTYYKLQKWQVCGIPPRLLCPTVATCYTGFWLYHHI